MTKIGRLQIRRNESGAILLVVVLGICAIIAAIAYFGGLTTEAHACKNQLETIEHWNTQWLQSKAGGQAGDQGLCAQMNAMIDKYNASRCAKDYGALPKEKCE